MSLLMQALKKAEQSKQKQSALAAEASLPSADIVPVPLAASSSIIEVVAKAEEAPEVADAITTSLERHKLPATFANAEGGGLSLSPQMEASTTEPANAAIPSGSPESTFSSASNAIDVPEPAHVAVQSFVPIEPASSPVSGDFVQEDEANVEENRENPSQQAHKQNGVGGVESKSSEATKPDGKMRTRVDPRQSELAAQKDAELASERGKAKSVFSAKSPSTNTRKRWFAIFGGLLVIALGGGFYVFWNFYVAEVSPLPVRSQAIQPAPSNPASDVIATSESASSQVASPNASDGEQIKHLPSVSGKNVEPSQTVSSQILSSETGSLEKGTSGTKTGAIISPALSNRSALKSESSGSSRLKTPSDGSVDISNGIQIRKSQSGDQLNPALSSAYLSFTSGDVHAAEQQYQIVLRQEPNNRDALLGLAAIALNQRQAERAGTFYGRLLELDPSDPEAIAGLTSLQQGDPVQSESRLKKALNQSPHSGAILFSLGNLYAQQSRWSDAQQSYFRAFDSVPTNADYAFNLAVSLDRLNQTKLAKDYYQRALSLTQTGPGNFSRSSVQKRIEEIDLRTVE